jgi:nitrogenase molybdenum-cofactor synthesis protein NifE
MGYADNKVHAINLTGEFWHVLPLLDELGWRMLCALSDCNSGPATPRFS